MEANKSTRFKAVIFSIFVHGSILLAIAMASYEVVKETVTEMEFFDKKEPAPIQEIEVVDSKPETQVAKALPEKKQRKELKVAPQAVQAKPKAKAKPAEEDDVVADSPVIVPPPADIADDSEKMLADEDAPEAQVAMPVTELPKKEEPQEIADEPVETVDPQEKLPEPVDTAKTEATVPLVKPADEEDDEDWTEEIRQATLPSAQASQPPARPAPQAASGAGGLGAGVRPDTDLTPRGKNPLAPYPQTARLNRIEGTSVLRFKVDGNGNVSEAWVHQSSGYKLFDAEALKTQKQWKYLPGKTGTFQKPWVFRLKGKPEEMPYKIRR